MAGIGERVFSREIRFLGFEGEWGEKRLGEVMSVPKRTRATAIDKNKLLTVKLRLKGVSKNESTDTLLLGSTDYFVRKKGQFIYGKQNLFNGVFGLVPDELDGFLSSSDVLALDIDRSRADAQYVLYFLGRKDVYERLESIATGTGSKRVHEKMLLDTKMHFPSLREQAKIAGFLSAIDEKIRTERKILSKYQIQKRYLLRNMFV